MLIPIPITADSILAVSKFMMPSVRMPETFFPPIKMSLIHLIDGWMPYSFLIARQTATAEKAVSFAGSVIPFSGA